MNLAYVVVLLLAFFERSSGMVRSDTRLTAASSRGAVVLVDVENVRGKTAFDLSHSQILDRATLWTERRGLRGRVSLIVDHGSEQSAYWLPERELTVVFGGPTLKADDVIARDVTFCQETFGSDVVVVTADQELMRRCRRAAARSGGPGLQIVPPMNFLDDMEAVVSTASCALDESFGTNAEVTLEPPSELVAEIEARMEVEISLMGKIIEAEAQLKRRRGSPKKRQKLTTLLHGLKEKLARLTGGPSTLEQVTAVWTDETIGYGAASKLSRSDQDMLLARWENHRISSGRNEKTGDRVVLAERLRRQLEAVVAKHVISSDANENNEKNPAKFHAEYVNTLSSRFSAKPVGSETILTSQDDDASDSLGRELDCSTADGRSPLRLVIISDTHGYEADLTGSDAPDPWVLNPEKTEEKHQDSSACQEVDCLPDGDVLLHLGDFAIDGQGRQQRRALGKFDEWLSRQPHATKIVLRGNHDPVDSSFPESGATFITDPTMLSFGGWKFSFIPYLSHRRVRIPSGADVLATHVPPKAVLDRCISGDLAGSAALRSAVEKMAGRPPLLWACGHIHEGRGSRYVRFGGSPGFHETLVLNAANANPGRATEIVHGPVILDLSEDKDATPFLEERVPMHDGLSRYEFDPDMLDLPDDVGQLLLAVDLGLRMGASCFDEDGVLLWYEQFQFQDSDELRKRAPELIEKLEIDLNENSGDPASDKKRWVVSHVVIEGGDAVLLDAWRAAVEDFADPNGSAPRILNIKAEEWRAELLLPKEKKSAASAKAAARLIARQIVCDCGKMERHEGKFSTDAAEAVAVGFYMARKFGWVSREPAVRRASNGIVLIPRASNS